MKVVILAGGFGTRISEESHLRPKPMIEIGGQPILWHIMKHFSRYGHNEFIICAGYKQELIKEYFANYYLHRSDITFDFRRGEQRIIHDNVSEPWQVTVVDTGLNTMTGGRVKRIQKFVGDEPFMLTYGDGVCDVDLNKLLEFHNAKDVAATMTAVQPGGRFGSLGIDDAALVHTFAEKTKDGGGWINGGFMALTPEIFSHIADDTTTLEREPLEYLAQNGKLAAFCHDGFWQCMDTLRDKEYLESLISKGVAPWIG